MKYMFMFIINNCVKPSDSIPYQTIYVCKLCCCMQFIKFAGKHTQVLKLDARETYNLS